MGAISECVGPGSKAAEVRRVLPMEKCAVFLVFDAHLCGGPQKVDGNHQGIEALRRLRAQHACSIQSGAHHFKRNAFDQSINGRINQSNGPNIYY